MIIDANWLASHLDDENVIIIDSRGIMPFRFSHIKNAMPLGVEKVISTDENGSYLVIAPQVAEQIFTSMGIDDTKVVIVYGEYPDPSLARIVWTLIYFGHSNVKILDIGFENWLQSGYPVTKDFETKNAATKPDRGFVAHVRTTERADAQFIYQEKDKPETTIIDARTPQEHLHARIPGSILHNYEEGIGDMGKMIKDVEVLKQDFEKLGITRDKQIVCYCHSGIRAAHTYLQLKQAGFVNVRLYDGSIIDWAKRKYPLG
ncbi:Thiosulfate sulfurtransferase [Candidatus Nitrosocosmicus oleophilus]|jgi:thiosulfate/3-mercaptopyruvate sulfurtransferase|uniref:Thiosulfate sulfurtransferase n=1 Tax=Candidatus Nitrosocosmicus oleophilus TaxID=1353260 RepID=A0A654M7N0_9ARCH|nr:rhodanese-like domain-containing protein [Candidatus Nitrosocosmicus oleophilus]ALI35572.1 Thiosulfate sulfurtransferase [Candidatus Nitrosocosmicus oleophilus]